MHSDKVMLRKLRAQRKKEDRIVNRLLARADALLSLLKQCRTSRS